MENFSAVPRMSCFIAPLVVLFAGLLSGNAVAAWSTNPAVNNAISTAANYQSYPIIISDGSGGAIITWQDARSGTNDIYAQRINASGVVQWTADGVKISTNGSYNPTLISDGSGGAIITWQDSRSGASWDIYAQRINASGVAQWTADGVAISTAAEDQVNPTLTSDGSGGAIITWQDSRNFGPIPFTGPRIGSTDIYAQRINASGVVQWAADGIAISTAANHQSDPTLISDGSGGAIIIWQDFRSGTYKDIYVQRINASGVVQWLANGVPIFTDVSYQLNPTIISDGSGGAIITWWDLRGGSDIYAQRLDASGVVQWTANGVGISKAANDQFSPDITSDGSGGAIITWWDFRSGTNQDIYAQRISSSGVVQWGADGVAISTDANDQFNQTIISDGSGGAIITWQDFRSGTNQDIYAQRIGANGAFASLPVVEFYNTNLDHYFITANAGEAAGIDGGSAGPGWIRTGNSFKSGGSTAVCRFYGSQIPGPNSHFYTSSTSECNGLKQLQATTPATQKRWNFESLDFISTPPINGICPTGTAPVYRAYNNGFARGVDSNHRISSATAAIQEVVARGWIDEGIVMCAPI
ncbi:MAG: hypothetical protein DID91_2727703605 [Candidatus Nitrotoga sp. MKT]|nr:MAG: hypothetical protein DID91_2727703605 [Candidatus Nitrotoga sp. MKT]